MLFEAYDENLDGVYYFCEIPNGTKFFFVHEAKFASSYPKSPHAEFFKHNTYVKIDESLYKCINNGKIKKGYSYENTEVYPV